MNAVNEGCWVYYAYDGGPYLISARPTEIEALSALNGESLSEADDRRRKPVAS